jgi:hypothetical protein
VTVTPPSTAWPRSDKLQLIAIVVAALSIIVGAVVAIAVPEIRCRIGLQSCSQGEDWTGVARTLGDPINDARMPFAAMIPPAVAPAGRYPAVETPFGTITNRGTPVPVAVSGSYFYAYSSVDIVWSRPDGSVYGRYAAQTDERGLFDYALLWRPEPSRGVAGNDGAWTVKVTDRTSGWDDVLQLNVRSDGQTPPAGSWADPEEVPPSPFVAANLNAGTSGTLCEGVGTLATVRLEGFTPNARVRVDYRLPDSRVALAQGVRVDGKGQVTITTVWRSPLCTPDTEFVYPVQATEIDTGRAAGGSILLHTKETTAQ